jgi:hypothetical protein
VPFQRKAPAKHILRQAIDRQRHKLMRLIAQQRRGIAARICRRVVIRREKRSA